MPKENRFLTLYTEGSELTMKKTIIVDTQTGVQYLCWSSGNAGGITPLLDCNGDVMICLEREQ